MAEDAGVAQGPVEEPPVTGLADIELETAEVIPEPEAEELPPLPEVEIGADPVQTPVNVVPDADIVIATADLGDGVVSDTDAPGEEFVRLSREDTRALARPTRPELLEALAVAVLNPPSAMELAGGDIGPDDLVRVAQPGEAEELREHDLAAFLRRTGAVWPDLFATLQEETTALERSLTMANAHLSAAGRAQIPTSDEEEPLARYNAIQRALDDAIQAFAPVAEDQWAEQALRELRNGLAEAAVIQGRLVDRMLEIR